MPAQSKVQRPPPKEPDNPKKFKPIRKYKSEEIDLDLLAKRAYEVLCAKPFRYQLEVAAAILRGNDVIIDVGTGAGKPCVSPCP